MKMHIRHGTLLALLFFPLLSLAQVTSGPLSLTGTGCVQVSVDAMSQVAMNISGSWSGTIQPEAAIAGQSAANVQVTPSTSSTAASTITANGLYTATVAGYQTFLLCGNTVTGTATVYFSTTQRSASGRSGGGGGGGAGTVTSVLGTTNQITSDGSTTTPTLSIPSTFIAPGTIQATTSLAGTSLRLNGATSGASTFTPAAIAGTTTNAVAMSNTLTGPNGDSNHLTYGFSSDIGGSGIFNIGGSLLGIQGSVRGLGAFTMESMSTAGMIWATDTAFSGFDAGIFRAGTNRIEISNGTTANALGSLSLNNINAVTFSTATNCSNAAAPAVCAAAASGVVAVPTGTNPTLTINTTAVTANSRIFLQIDESATIAATTCNTTLSTLIQPVVTARTAATSFTIQIGAIIATNPACVSFFLVN